MNKRLAKALYHHRTVELRAQIDSEFMRGRLTVSGERRVDGQWFRLPISDHTSYVIDWLGTTPPSGYDDAPCAFRRELRRPKSFEDWRAEGEVRQVDQLRLARDQDLPNSAWRQPAPGTMIKVPTRTVIDDEVRDPEIAWLIREWVADPDESSKRHGEEIGLEMGNFVRRHWGEAAPPSATRAIAQQALDRYLGNGGDVRTPLVQRHPAQEVAPLPEDEPKAEPGDIYYDLTITEVDWERLVKAVVAPHDAENRENEPLSVSESFPAAEHAVAAALSPSAPDAEIKTDPKPVPILALVKFLKKHGQKPMAKLWKAAKLEFPKNTVSRRVLQAAILEAFDGPVKIGRPKLAD
jgi:hypothetical protein